MTQGNHSAEPALGLAVNKSPLGRSQSASASMAINNTKEGNLKEKAEEVARKVVRGSNVSTLGGGGGEQGSEYTGAYALHRGDKDTNMLYRRS